MQQTKKRSPWQLLTAETAPAITAARELIVEYAESLGCSPCLRHIDHELAHFPHPFAPPGGRLILAMVGTEAAGVVGVKRIDPAVCEMARLYVRPKFRGMGLGKALALECLRAGDELGYRKVRLYTLPAMGIALAMYGKMGFVEIDPYTEHPVDGAVYLEINRIDKE